MTVKVKIPAPLVSLTNDQSEVECDAENIASLIDNLDAQFPGIKDRLTENGKPRRFINFYINNEDIRFLENENSPVKDGDEVSIVPAIAGG